MEHKDKIRMRRLAPDLARGFMLLFIALAHANLFLFSTNREITFMDQLSVFFRQIIVDGRAFPLFSILFGYGLFQLLKSQERKGVSWHLTKKMYRQRGAWMILIGFVHVTLFYDDIIGVYGLIALLFASLFLRLSNKSLIMITVFFLILVGVFGQFMPRGFDALNMEIATRASTENPIEASIDRLVEWLFLSPLLLYQVIPGVLIGIWVARHQILDYPVFHKRALMTAAIVGLMLSTFGAIPMALMSSLFWTNYSEGTAAMAKSIHTIAGYAGGIGWTALIGLVVIKLDKQRGEITTAIAAVGQRSMSFYLFQSIVFVFIFAPYTRGLGDRIGQTGSDLIAIGVWVLSVWIANFMHNRSLRGPAETFLRQRVTIKKV